MQSALQLKSKFLIEYIKLYSKSGTERHNMNSWYFKQVSNIQLLFMISCTR